MRQMSDPKPLRFVRTAFLEAQPQNILELFSLIEHKLRAAGIPEDKILKADKRDGGKMLLWCEDLNSAVGANSQLSDDKELKRMIDFARTYIQGVLTAALELKSPENDPLESADKWSAQLDRMGGGMSIGFNSSYIVSLVTQCVAKKSHFGKVVALLERKAEHLNEMHIQELLKLADQQSELMDMTELIDLLQNKAEALDGKNVASLLILAIKKGSSDNKEQQAALAKLIHEKAGTLDEGHERLLEKLGIAV